MNFYALSALINIVLLVIAQIILIINIKKNKPIIYFSFFNIAVIFWAVSYFFWQTSNNYTQALFWVKMLMIGAIFASPTFLHFAGIVTGKIKKLTGLVIISYLLAVFFCYIDFTSPLYIANLQEKLNIPFFPTAGIHYSIYLIQWVLWLIIGFGILFKSMQKTSGEEKEFLSAITISTLISLSAGSLNYFLWYNIPIPPVATSVTAAYSIVVAFLLMRRKFYNINLFYFEFFAVIVVLISLLQFFLKDSGNMGVNIITFSIVILSAYFLVHSRIREREHLEQIETLNHSLNTAIDKIINTISDPIIIVNKRYNIVKANKMAIKIFDHNYDEQPKDFLDFTRGKVNQGLPMALKAYFEENQDFQTAEILIPQHYRINLSFSPFSIEKENDAAIMIIKMI